MKKILISLFLVLGFPSAHSQLTLEDCYAGARENYPLIKRYDLIAQSEHYSLSAADKAWIPQASLSAKASYQSDVVSMPLSIPGLTVPSLRKDQYQATVDVSQTLWDGGNIRAHKHQIRASSEVERSRLEVDLYSLQERVNNLFFGVLLLEEQIRLAYLYNDNLRQSFQKVEALTANGVGTQADLDAVAVQMVTNDQNKVSLESNLKAYRTMLGQMLNRDMTAAALVRPAVDASLLGETKRPELTLFQAQNAQIDIQKQAINSKAMPQFNAYVQLGYGYPGLNMLKGTFGDWALAGVRMQWNFGAFYTKKNEKMNLAVNKKNVDTQRELFLYNIRQQVTQNLNEIKKYRLTTRQDSLIVALKVNIERASAAKAENGTMSVTDYMRDVIDTQSARQNSVLHQMQLLMSVYDLKNTMNN